MCQVNNFNTRSSSLHIQITFTSCWGLCFGKNANARWYFAPAEIRSQSPATRRRTDCDKTGLLRNFANATADKRPFRFSLWQSMHYFVPMNWFSLTACSIGRGRSFVIFLTFFGMFKELSLQTFTFFFARILGITVGVP